MLLIDNLLTLQKETDIETVLVEQRIVIYFSTTLSYPSTNSIECYL